MYAAGPAVGKSEHCNKTLSGKNVEISAAQAEFGRPASGAVTPLPVRDLYDHIIFLDGARGECYGRTKSNDYPTK
jgi:hypothetical protein